MLLPRTERARQERMDIVDFGGKARDRSVTNACDRLFIGIVRQLSLRS